jgi:DNA-directed RNA polymerase subunit beta'
MGDTTTVGRLLFNQALPPEYRDEAREIKGKKDLTELLSRVAKEKPDEYVDVLKNVSDVTRHVVSDHGRTASLSLKDLILPPQLKKMRDDFKAKVEFIKEDPKLSPEEKGKRIVDFLVPEIEKVQKGLMDYGDKSSGMMEQVRTGSRGNMSQLMQLLFGDMIVMDHKDRPIPVPGLHGYGEGVTPAEMWAGSYGSRKGYVSVQLATQESGHYGKQITQVAHRVVVTENDCGSEDVGLTVPGDNPFNVGSVLAHDAGDLKAGHTIEKKDLPKLEGKDVLIRSATTCQAKEGICSKCAGMRERGDFPHIGDAVGVTSARAIAEPLTQMALSVKHTGGVAKKEKPVTFKEVDQFIQVPEAFVGAATLAEKDGKVSRIDKAPQGGSYVYIGDEEHYVPADQELTVKVNSPVEAGDVLSDGIPNPHDIVKHKGIGEGRRYFTEQYGDLLKRAGAGTHRRNLEAVSRAFINRVKINEPDGYAGHFAGDIVSYDDFVKDYEPRKGYQLMPPARAVGQYLEKPVLHYSIGTRITPSMSKKLSAAKIHAILAHKDTPVFEPVVSRAMNVSTTDKDWMTRLGGFDLKKGLIESASRGASSQLGGTSYIPAVAAGTSMYEDIAGEDYD